jgi:hypothetical protein
VNLWMIVCSCSYPKNVLDKSAEDILPGGLFWDKRKFSSFLSTLQNHSHIVDRFSLSASVSFCFIWILYGYRCKKLTDADKEKQVTMYEWFCNMLENDENFLLSQNRPPGRISSADLFKTFLGQL